MDAADNVALVFVTFRMLVRQALDRMYGSMIVARLFTLEDKKIGYQSCRSQLRNTAVYF